MSGGAIIARQNRYMHAFRSAGATNPETAKSLSELRVVPIGIFYRMEKSGVFQKTEDGRYYMDEAMAENFVIRRSKYARMVLWIFAAVLLMLYLINGGL